MPQKPPQQNHALSPRTTTPKLIGRRKILIVDDELDVLRSTQMLVQRLGYDCVVLPDPEHMLEVIEHEMPDLLLQDLLMPTLDMQAVFASIRSHPATAELPIVLFSASDELSEKAADLDATGYLQKPFSEQQLRQVLENILGPGPEPSKAPGVAKALTPEVIRKTFHEYRNILTALNNYAQFLLNSKNVRDPEREAAEEINRLLLDLEKRNELLHRHMLGDESDGPTE